MVVAAVSVFALLAGLVVAPATGLMGAAPARADSATTFPAPEHYIEESYQDVTGVHVYVTEPTIEFYAQDDEITSGEYPHYFVELEVAEPEGGPTLVTASLDTVRYDSESEAAWTAPPGIFEFGKSYVLRYRLTANGQASEWVGWLAFAVTLPGAAPTLVSPQVSALVADTATLVAQVPDYVQTPDVEDVVVFSVESGWQDGAPTTVAQLESQIGVDGIAQVEFNPTIPEGEYRWRAQRLGAGYSVPSEFRTLNISSVAPTVDSINVTTNTSVTTVSWQLRDLALAPVQFVDVTLTPGNLSQQVPAAESSVLFEGLAMGDYVATITTTNVLGTSSPVSARFGVPNPPTSPQQLSATVTGTRAHISWEPPVGDGGSPVDQYRVEVKSYDGGGNQTFHTTELTVDVDVQVGFNYTVVVYARNDVGEGEPAVTSFTVFGVPSAPQNVEVRPGDGFVNVYWDTPENIGGKWPTKYRVHVKGVGGFRVDAHYGRMGIQINGLQNGQSYTVRVRAINEIGRGEAATIRHVVPVSSDIDSDGDGLPDVAESRFGTSVSIPDTDSDGLSDVDETLKLSAFLSPTIADTDEDGVIDADEDSDGDGISNVTELSAGTNPGSPDTDHDSLTDTVEQASGTSPILPDTDVDGVDDATELAIGLDPLNFDSDGDGVTDAQTIAYQSISDVAQFLPQISPYLEPQLDPASRLGGVNAVITGPAGRLDELVVSSSSSNDVVGALTTVAAVFDSGPAAGDQSAIGPLLAPASLGPRTAPVEPSATQLTFSYAENVSPERLQDLAPVKWNPATYLWEFADNDVSLSTADRTISILSPELGLRYAVVDLATWRSHVTECDSGATGRPQLDVEFVIDQMPSVQFGDSTNERFTAALTILDSLKPGDSASVRLFGLLGIILSGGSGSSPGAWEFETDLSDGDLTVEQRFGLNSREQARTVLTTLQERPGSVDPHAWPTEDAGWDPERVLLPSVPGPSLEVNPYVPDATPLECRKTVVVLITDGGTGGHLFYDFGTEDPDPNHPFAEAGVPVHVLDLGIGAPGSADWLVDLAETTDGSYSYVPTANDLAGWIEDVAPTDWAAGDPTKDTDHDTIPDMVEIYGISATLTERGEGLPFRFYSNPLRKDSDHDRIPDNLEIGQRLDAGTQGAVWSAENINRNFWVVSDPGSKDGDSDGLWDRSEIDAGMDPLAGDGDGDGLLDGQEEMNGTFAQLYDTDSDGFSDAYEVQHEDDGYDPLAFNEKVSETEWLAEAAVGFFCGEIDICSLNTIPWLVGNISSGLLVFGDLRDGIALVAKGDPVAATFCAIGLFPVLGDVAGTAAKVVKFILRLMGVGPTTKSAKAAAEALKILNETSPTPGKFVRALRKIDSGMVDALENTYKLDKRVITKLVSRNGIERMSVIAKLKEPSVKFYTYTAETLPKYMRTGRAGERALMKLDPHLENYKQERTLIQLLEGDVTVTKARYYDGMFKEGFVTYMFEAKVGYASSAFIHRQVTKDIARLTNLDGNGVTEWHFFASKITGKIGPSLPILKRLNDAGITVVFHFPGAA